MVCIVIKKEHYKFSSWILAEKLTSVAFKFTKVPDEQTDTNMRITLVTYIDIQFSSETPQPALPQ